MSNFKRVVIYFLVSKLSVIYHPLLSSYLALSKNIAESNTTRDMCLVKVTYIESTDLPRSLMRRLGLHFMYHLLESGEYRVRASFRRSWRCSSVMLERCLPFVILR
jgi:hypothetical protein